jgi:chitinase
MFKFVLWAAVAVLSTGCTWGNLGFYLYPQAESTGISEVKTTGPLAGLEVVGYLPAYKIPKIQETQTRHLTDLVYYTLGVRSDGTVAHAVLTDEHRDFLLKAKKDYGVRIVMGVTDHSQSGNLAAVASDPKLRTKFASRLTEFLVTEGFDGADFDWEYPSAGQASSYAALLAEVHSQFSPHNLRLSVAVSPGKPLSPQGFAAVDRVHGMLYDDDGRHSTLENAAEHVQELLAAGVSPTQLLLGVPFYGRGYTRYGPAWSSALSYKTIRERYGVNPSQDTVDGYYFNGIETVRRKVEFAKKSGLSGVMVWEIGQDTDDDTSLLSAITQARKDLDRVN